MSDFFVTDEMLRAGVKAMEPDRIQGFSTPLDAARQTWGAPHYVRDVWLAPGKQVLWRGLDANELHERCEMERFRLGLEAALRARAALPQEREK